MMAARHSTASRGRITFPDPRRARALHRAFGGRAMDPNARAKYLNSRKRRCLTRGATFTMSARARRWPGQTADRGRRLYGRDRPCPRGVRGAVAPQHRHHRGSVAADVARLARAGDRAGRDTGRLARANAVDRSALPMTAPGQALRFAFLPRDGPRRPDPGQGAGRCRPFWTRRGRWSIFSGGARTEGRVFDSPERRAALDKALGMPSRKSPTRTRATIISRR